MVGGKEGKQRWEAEGGGGEREGNGRREEGGRKRNPLFTGSFQMPTMAGGLKPASRNKLSISLVGGRNLTT